MEPKKKSYQLIDDLMKIYGLDAKQAIEIAMLTVDQVISYRDIHSQEFWIEAMDCLEELRLKRK